MAENQVKVGSEYYDMALGLVVVISVSGGYAIVEDEWGSQKSVNVKRLMPVTRTGGEDEQGDS